ncbi:MAG: adenylyltransferase/cytidyltransferase family protein [Patescibacteria group bacterium]|nr:adenylyltransferase/cytidyltransferase family protein [Patescibacteria group bacterium]
MASPIKLAVLRTTTYASIFNYHLSFEELYRYLISPGPVSISKLKPYFIVKPQSVNHFNQLKWPIARRAAKILSFLPTVKLVAVTGALAMNNAGKNDDIDLMIITASNRLWLTRLLSAVLLFPHLRKGPTLKVANKLCLNLWLDESALALNQRNLFVAHEICQLKPLFNRHHTYQKFLTANLWYKQFLPNWTPEKRTLPNREQGRTLMDFLNSLAFHLQYVYMKSKITRERVSKHFAFFHPRPTAKIVLQEYRRRLQGRTLTGNLAEGQAGTTKPEGPSLTEKTVLATGCFDVLHSEHLKFLKAAKKQGTQLLVGLETDSRVRKLKGSGRPINPLNIRLKNLRQLGIADQVFALPKQFNDLNHFTALINQIKPGVLAVSASTPHLAVKRRIIQRLGGRVIVVLPHNPRISTTKMLK